MMIIMRKESPSASPSPSSDQNDRPTMQQQQHDHDFYICEPTPLPLTPSIFDQESYMRRIRERQSRNIHDLPRIHDPFRVEGLLDTLHDTDGIAADFHEEGFFLTDSDAVFALMITLLLAMRPSSSVLYIFKHGYHWSNY